MWILTVYVLVVVVMELVVVAVGLALDRIYPSISLTISLSLFFLVLWFGWVIAVHLTKPKHEKSTERVAWRLAGRCALLTPNRCPWEQWCGSKIIGS